MTNMILDTDQQQQASVSPLVRFRQALTASRKLQADGRRVGHDRVDLYYEDVEGDWLESWQEDK
jgi:hypothetical protein